LQYTRAQKDFMELEREQLRKDQVLVLPGTAAVSGLFSLAPLEVPLQLQRKSWKRDLGHARNCRILYCF